MHKLNVLQVTHDLNIGGLQKLVVNICLNIDRSKFNVAVCCLRELGPLAEPLQKNNIPIFEINQIMNGKVNYFSFRDVYKVIKEQKTDIIHTHNTNPFIDGGLAAIMARVPVRIHTDHAREYPDDKRYMIAEKVLSYFYNQIVAVSDQTRCNLIHWEKINPNKIITIENGVAIKPLEAAAKKENRKFIIGTIGRLSNPKGYEYLIESVPHLKKLMNNFKLQIIGDGELMQKLQNLVINLDVGEHVTLVGEQNDVSKFYVDFDLFVISSISEGLPLVLLEAMANKVPILTTNVGGIPAVVKDGKSAVIIEPRNPRLLAEKIHYLYSNPEISSRLALNAFETFTAKFSIEKMMNSYENLYLKFYSIES